MVNSLTSEEGSRDDKIIAQYKMLYVYKVVRLIMIAIILTYFLGCFWYLFCHVYGDLEGNTNTFIKEFDLENINL